MNTRSRIGNLGRLILLILCAALMLSCFYGCVGPDDGGSDATVMDISIKTEPKTEYVLGEQFDISGGVIELLYTDSTTKDVPFTDENVTITQPDMTTVGNKTVTVDYDGFTATYMITVSNAAFTITFELNYQGAPAASTASVEEGEAITAPAAPTRAGYRFDGWFTAAEGGEAFDFSEGKATANLTLYAHWTQVYTVTFNLNYEGAPAATLVTVEAGKTVAQTSAPSTLREGFLFNGWFTAADGGEEFDFAAAVTGDVTVYAKWTEVGDATTYEVIFNYGTSAIENRTELVLEGEAVAKPADPSVSGRQFEGWFTDEACTKEYNFSTPVTEDITLYAKWLVTAYTINYYYTLDGVETLYATRTAIPGLFATNVAMPTISGYYFVNTWYSDKECTQAFSFTTPVNDDLNLYAKPLKRNLFEAEFTYIDPQKTGQGSSNNMTGLEIIDRDNGTAQASNGYYVDNLYYRGAFLEFVITAESAVDDAVLILRLSAAWEDMYLAPEDITIDDNNYGSFVISSAPALTNDDGTVQKDNLGYVMYDEDSVRTYDYSPIALEGAIPFDESMYDKRPFNDVVITTSLHLDEGVNVIRLTVNNNISHDGTIHASAPMIDCMYICSDVALSWEPRTTNTDNIQS